MQWITMTSFVPERRTALVGRELDLYKVEIAAQRLALQKKGF